MSTPLNSSDDPRHDDRLDAAAADRTTYAAGNPTTKPQDTVVVHDGPARFDQEGVLARERDEFGGMKFGAGFFGWLTATGLSVIVLAILAGAGVAFGLTNQDSIAAAQGNTGTAKTVGLVGGIVLLVILFVAYYCGGYVAGRMARFNGAKQGLAVWIWAIVIIVILALVGWIAGSQYNILAQLNLPRIPVDEGTVTTAGIIAAVAALLAALGGAILGGIAGTRYHRRVDRVGFAVDAGR
ncbi:hypothetical protein ABLG96_17555 [Nakamurella sp. A5-74]|uniref:Major facilitator superfamily (MFS) profile domain-containing protein n=1 Tax=Nakamurella sp. A5-74 TaxID=3158264 RepID=A0AAU8DLY1_9ACTN